MSYITGFFTPLITESGSPTSAVQTPGEGFRKPTEVSKSYFPDTEATSANTSRRSSISTNSTSSRDSLPGRLVRPHTGLNPLDALSREYPKPAEEIDVAKQLSLEPRKHSLYHSLKRSATSERAVAVEDAETKAKKLAAAKAEMLALAGKA